MAVMPIETSVTSLREVKLGASGGGLGIVYGNHGVLRDKSRCVLIRVDLRSASFDMANPDDACFEWHGDDIGNDLRWASGSVFRR